MMLVLGLVTFGPFVASARWTLALHGPGDRARLALGSEQFGGGILSYMRIRDPAATFMLDFHALERRPGRWKLEWRLAPMRINPATTDPSGLGAHELPGVAWLHDSRGVRSAAFVFWPVPFVLAVAGVALGRSGRGASLRARCNLCIRCGYDRAGLASGSQCPECGP
jgi:hypothetical protein